MLSTFDIIYVCVFTFQRGKAFYLHVAAIASVCFACVYLQIIFVLLLASLLLAFPLHSYY